MLLHIIPQAVNMNALKEIPCQQVVYITKGTSHILACFPHLFNFVLQWLTSSALAA
jgi:hypothetical protein